MHGELLLRVGAPRRCGRCVHNRGSGSRWQVGGSHSEATFISNIFNCLEDSSFINILVGSSDNTISCLDFLSLRIRVIVSKTVLAKVVLGVILGSSNSWGCCNNWYCYRSSSNLNNRDRSNLSNSRSGDRGSSHDRLDVVVVKGLGIRKVSV